MAVVALVFCIIAAADLSRGMHVAGSWDSAADLYHLLGVFAFQKTDPDRQDATAGRVYGNVTSSVSIPIDHTLLLLDDRGWNHFVESVEAPLSVSETCSSAFAAFEANHSQVYDQVCNPEGIEDVFRFVPCPIAGICRNQIAPTVGGSQFTFNTTDDSGPQFWHLLVISCSHGNLSSPSDTCHWSYDLDSVAATLAYDVWFVNGDPGRPHNLFYYQFSFQLQGLLPTYTVFLILYLPLLTAASIAACAGPVHTPVKLLDSSIVTEFLAVLLYFTHLALYSDNGRGFLGLQSTAELLVAIAQCLLMLFYLLLAHGWCVTVSEVRHKHRLGVIWALYCLLYLLVFLWQVVNLKYQDVDETMNAWENWPGFTLVAFRLCILPWFIYELRATYNLETHQLKLKFYWQLGLTTVTWFCYLPALVIALSVVSQLWRDKIFQGVALSTDYFFYCILVYLLWPTKGKIYFTLPLEEHQSLLQESYKLKDATSTN